MMKRKRQNKRRRGGLNLPRGISRANMGGRIIDYVYTRLNSWNTILIKRWSNMLPMLSLMGGWTLKMMSIRSIGWRARAVYLHLYLIRKYRISWLCTYNVRLVNVILLARLWRSKNHGLKLFWRPFSILFILIYCIVVVNSWRRWRITSPST